MKVPRLDKMSRTARAVAGAVIGLLVAAALLLLRGTEPIEGLELQLVDVRTRHFVGQRAPDPRIVLVEIQDEDVVAVREKWSVDWPWDLSINAALFQVLADAGVEAVLVDVLHLDRGAGLDDLTDAQAEGLTDMQRNTIAGEIEGAQAYGAAMRAVGDVVLGFQLSGLMRYEAPARVKAAEARLGRDAPAPGWLVPSPTSPCRASPRARFGSASRTSIPISTACAAARSWRDAGGTGRSSPSRSPEHGSSTRRRWRRRWRRTGRSS